MSPERNKGWKVEHVGKPGTEFDTMMEAMRNGLHAPGVHIEIADAFSHWLQLAGIGHTRGVLRSESGGEIPGVLIGKVRPQIPNVKPKGRWDLAGDLAVKFLTNQGIKAGIRRIEDQNKGLWVTFEPGTANKIMRPMRKAAVRLFGKKI
jgi:hypothetical protein